MQLIEKIFKKISDDARQDAVRVKFFPWVEREMIYKIEIEKEESILV